MLQDFRFTRVVGFSFSSLGWRRLSTLAGGFYTLMAMPSECSIDWV
jgi:hypothetical protein